MKQILKSIVVLAGAAVLAAGCAKEIKTDAPVINSDETVEVIFEAGLDNGATKAVSDRDGNAKCVNHWIMEVRDKDNHLYTREERSDVAAGTLSQTFKVTLVKGNDYSVQFWADTKGFYKTDSLTKVCMNSKVTKVSVQAYAANKDSLDCFSGNVNYKYSAGQKSITATLKRPLAQLNIQTTDLGDLWTTTKGETSRTEYDRFEPKKLCAAISVPTAFNVQDSSVSEVTSIELYSAAVHTAYQTDNATLEEHNNFYNHVNPATLLMGYVFAGSEKALYDVKFAFQSNGNDVDFTFSNVPLQRNYRTNVKGKLLTDDTEWTVTIDPDWDGELQPDASLLLSGEFSVSATKKVQFTKGNLYWDGAAFKLEGSQTDYPATWNTIHVGHFYWTKTTANSYAESYNESASAAPTDKFFADGSDADHTLSVDGQSGLYALSEGEWSYLLNTEGEESGRTGNRFAKANVNGVAGLIIFPDGYTTVPSDAGIATVNYAKSSFPKSSIAIATWSAMESAGCVFLPAAGNREGSSLTGAGSVGDYWSATPYASHQSDAFMLDFDDVNILQSTYIDRNYGSPIRLVKGTVSYPEAPALACVKIGDVTWAPVNCGYDANHTYGSLYQWGRKYGQPYEDGQLSLTDMTKADDTAENSGKFGKFNETTYNWFIGGVDNTLWNGSSKGTSDPCPTGWRVPTEAEFDALISHKKWGNNTVGAVSQTGYWFNGSSTASVGTGVFLPAAGVRYYSNGKAASRGSYGQYWSSSPGSSTVNYARYMGFDSTTADMQDRSRADGYSVRCVKE